VTADRKWFGASRYFPIWPRTRQGVGVSIGAGVAMAIVGWCTTGVGSTWTLISIATAYSLVVSLTYDGASLRR
jgi:glycerol-3-phosphate acyltransferase PlsY